MRTAAVDTASKGDRRRSAILRAARRVLVVRGYDRLVLREIAAAVGIRLGHLQYYFATRDDLIEAVVRAEFARNRAEVAAIAAGGGAATVRLAAVARHLIAVWARDGGRVYAVMSFLALHHPRFRALHREIYARFYRDLVPLLRERRPRASGPDLLRTARLITTVVDGALVQIPSRTFAAEAVAAVLRLSARSGTGH